MIELHEPAGTRCLFNILQIACVQELQDKRVVHISGQERGIPVSETLEEINTLVAAERRKILLSLGRALKGVC